MLEPTSQTEETPSLSGRSFGAVFATVFGIVATYQWWHAVKYWPISGGVSAILLVIAFAAPKLLIPAARLWQSFGLLLSRVTTPIIMTVIFFGVVLPTGLLLRLFGKDPLRLDKSDGVRSYWIIREPPGPDPDSLKNQF
jgi:hypothetical protein